MSSSWISMRRIAMLAFLRLPDQNRMMTRVSNTGMKATAISTSLMSYI